MSDPFAITKKKKLKVVNCKREILIKDLIFFFKKKKKLK